VLTLGSMACSRCGAGLHCRPGNGSNDGAVPVSTPPLKPLGMMQVLAPLLAVLLAVVVALLAAWALSLPGG